jgi:hypothetical protein
MANRSGDAQWGILPSESRMQLMALLIAISGSCLATPSNAWVYRRL